MEKAPVPYPPVMHSLASSSTLAWLIHQKFELGVPLYRQEKEWEAMGLSLSWATMSNWLLVIYRDWLRHIVGRLKQELLKQKYLHIDETHVQVLKEPGRKNTSDSYMWVYCSIKDEARPVRFFEYQPGRGGKYPEAFLKDYDGFIHTDAYSGYNGISDGKRCLCYTHLRRSFADALPKDLKDPAATRPAEAILRLNKIFDIESELAGLSPENRKEERIRREKPLLEAFWSWSEKNAVGVLPKSKLATAFGYALNHRKEFFNYLEDGNCSISNSLAENCIRPFVIGRKNWLFSGSPKGAKASAGIYTLVETAKANGLSPEKYIKHIKGDEFKYIIIKFFKKFFNNKNEDKFSFIQFSYNGKKTISIKSNSLRIFLQKLESNKIAFKVNDGDFNQNNANFQFLELSNLFMSIIKSHKKINNENKDDNILLYYL